MIKAAIFDVDGTLLDSMQIWNDVGEKYLKTLGITPHPGFSEKIYSLSLNGFAEYTKELYKLDLDTDTIIDGIISIVDDYYAHEVQLKPGAKEFLKSLYEQNIPMSIATASDKSYVSKAFKRLGIDIYLNDYYTCRDYNTSKNEPYIYIKAAEKFNCSKDEIYVFEDVLHAIDSARAAGFKIAGIFDAHSADQSDEIKAKSDIYITDYTGLTTNDFK